MSPRYLLDTNTVIYIRQRRPPAALARFEALPRGEAVLRELIGDGNDLKPHIVVAATHDGELVDLVKDRYAAYHFGDAIGPNGLMFDYHLLFGPATTRNAITLLQLQGAPESLVNRALARAAALDHERKATWAG